MAHPRRPDVRSCNPACASAILAHPRSDSGDEIHPAKTPLESVPTPFDIVIEPD